MISKYSLYLLMSFIYLSIEAIIELKQNDQITVNAQTYIYLSLDGFDKGSEVYIELKLNESSIYYDRTSTLYHKQCNSHSSWDFGTSFNSSQNINVNKNGTSLTYGFKINITKNKKYLLLKYQQSYYYKTITIKHIGDPNHKQKKIIFAVVIVIAILIIISIIVHINYCRPGKRKNTFLLPNTLPEQNYI